MKLQMEVQSVACRPTAGRNSIIDQLKGCGIIFVVMGHALQGSIADFDNNILFRWIYSFHMPLFVLLSGYFLKKNDLTELLRKLQRLVIPFVAWYGVSYLVYQNNGAMTIIEYVVRLYRSVDYGLWFLWVLFLCECAAYLALRLEMRIGTWGGLGGTILAVRMMPYSVLGLGLLKLYLPFFFAGYLIARYKKELARYRNIALFLAVVFYPLLFLQWSRVSDPPALAFLGQLTQRINLVPWGGMLYKYIVGGLGITLLYGLIRCKMVQRCLPERILTMLGRHTLEIYAIHFYLLGYGFGEGAVRIASTTGCALAISLVAALIIHRIPIVNRVLVGVLPPRVR